MYNAILNLLANRNIYKNKTWDKLVAKGIEFENMKEVFEIYHYHTFFKYYPHYDTTLSLVKKVAERNDKKEIYKLIMLLGKLPLVKLNDEIRTFLRQLVVIAECEEVDKERFGKAVRRIMEEWV